MKESAGRVAGRLQNASTVTVVSHIDADGIAAAGIASKVLDMAGIDNEVVFAKKLDHAFVEGLLEKRPELVWFTDLGSGSLDLLQGLECVITDHHVPSSTPSNGKRRTLFDYGEPSVDILQVNPHLAGRDGSNDVSGAGCAYLVARAITDEALPLSHLAIVGAVGDMQDRSAGRLVGTNREILAEAESVGVIEAVEDLNFFGRETRPVWKMLQYASDIRIDGITEDYEGSMNFLLDLEINLKRREVWRAWVDLSKGEKRAVVSALSRLVPMEDIVGEVYLLPLEKKRTPLHEAKEFATLLNSCGRYDSAKLGMEVCKGDRKESLDLALGLRDGHKKQLVEAMSIFADIGVRELEHVQYIQVGSLVRDTIVGTVAGMLLSSGRIDGSKPIFAFADSDDGIKVSGRGTKPMVDRGLDLSEIMHKVTEKLGGVGGGHNIAAGATIQPGQEEEFLSLANEMVGGQMG